MKTNSFHEIVLVNDFIPLYVLTVPELYNELNKRTKDTIVANALNSEHYKYYKIKQIEPLFLNKSLSKENMELVKNSLLDLTFEDAEKFNLSLYFVYDLIIEKLKTYNWYIQSPAIKFIRKKSVSELNSLTEKQQEILGRNILQVANGTESEANNYLEEIKNNPNKYPISFIKGIIFEVFINEENYIRYKDRKIKEIIEIIENINDNSIETIIAELLNLMDKGLYKYDVEDYECIIGSQSLNKCSKFLPIINLLKKKLETDK